MVERSPAIQHLRRANPHPDRPARRPASTPSTVGTTTRATYSHSPVSGVSRGHEVYLEDIGTSGKGSYAPSWCGGRCAVDADAARIRAILDVRTCDHLRAVVGQRAACTRRGEALRRPLCTGCLRQTRRNPGLNAGPRLGSEPADQRPVCMTDVEGRRD